MIYLLKSPEAKKLDNGEYEHFFSLKIGYTEDETVDIKKNKRLSVYFAHHRTTELIYVIPNGTEEQEKKLHYKFKDLRWDNSDEWYIYDQSIIDYFKSATLEELDKLSHDPNKNKKKRNSSKGKKESKKLLGYLFNNEGEIDKYLEKLFKEFGDNITYDKTLDYVKLDPEINKEKLNNYFNIINREKTGIYCSNDTINNKISEFLKHYQELTIKKDRLKLLCDLDEADDTKEVINVVLNQLQDSDQVKSYFVNLGSKRIRELSYNVTLIKKELGIVTFSPELLEAEVYSKFNEGEKITLSDAKKLLTEIYTKLDYKKTAKTNDLSNWFEIKPMKMRVNIDGASKVVRALEIVSKKN